MSIPLESRDHHIVNLQRYVEQSGAQLQSKNIFYLATDLNADVGYPDMLICETYIECS